jgi:hypothetical protein
VKAHFLEIVTYSGGNLCHPVALEHWRMIMEQEMLSPGAMESYSEAMETPQGSVEALPVVMKKIHGFQYCRLNKIRHKNREGSA